jgi:hypothetical protein
LNKARDMVLFTSILAITFLQLVVALGAYMDWLPD